MWRSTLWMNLIDDGSSTNYKLKRKKKREKEWKMREVFKSQNAEGSKCFKCAAWNALFITKQAVIISKSFHHFAKVSSLRESLITSRCDARPRWRELSMARALDDASPWSRDEWDIRHKYNFVIMYQFDVQNVNTNALIRRLNDQSFEKIKNRFENQTKTLLIVDKLEAQSIDFERKNEKDSKKFTFVEKISRANKKNKICFKIRRRLSRTRIYQIISTVSSKMNFSIKQIVYEFLISIIWD